MRIVVVSDLPHFVMGGAEMQAARLIEAWCDAGHQVRCFGRRMGPGPVTIGRHAIEVHRIRTTDAFGRAGRALSYAASLSWLLLRHRRWADIVYTRFLGEAAATASVWKAIGVLAAPLVATPANTRGSGDTQLLRGLPFGDALLRFVDRHCDAINLIAADMVDELRSVGFRGDNFTRIPNGIALQPVAPRDAQAPARWIAVGRLAPQKGYDLLLDALARMREALLPGQVRIVGDGPERLRLQAQADALGLSDRIEWCGERAPHEVARLLDSSHLFLLPSRYEGLANAAIEAMERGLPMVLTRCGGIDHYVDETTGWTVPVGDVDALANALSHASKAGVPKLIEMGHAARSVAEANFDMGIVASRYLALFESLVARRKAAA